MKSDKVLTRNIGKGGKIIIPTEIMLKYDLKAGNVIDWHISDEIRLTFSEMIKKEKGRK